MTSSRLKAPRNILLVEDEANHLELYKTLLYRQLTTSRIEVASTVEGGFDVAGQRLFDIVLIDVTMPYRGSPYGGLHLYEQLLGRYGADSLVVYSNYTTEALVLREFPYLANFIEVKGDYIGFTKSVAAHAAKLRKRQRCFVAMPFGKNYEPIWRAVSSSLKLFFKPVRIDRRSFTGSIIDRILRELREAKLVLLVTIDKNPNVFYEAGFAQAMGKEIVTVTDEYSALPFDIKGNNAIAYKGDLKKLERLLSSKLRQLV